MILHLIFFFIQSIQQNKYDSPDYFTFLGFIKTYNLHIDGERERIGSCGGEGAEGVPVTTSFHICQYFSIWDVLNICNLLYNKNNL